MQRPTIPDKDIHDADPEQLLFCFENWIKKIAFRYRSLLMRTAAKDEDDLFQVGCLALLKAQEKYDPAGGATFLSFSFDYIRSAMRRELEISADGEPPVEPLSLNKLIAKNEDITLLDTIPDTAPTAEESIVEDDSNQETAEAVRAAIDRLKNVKQREVITRCWLNGQDRTAAADEMGISVPVLRNIDLEARHKLRRDHQLREYAIPFFHVGVNRFRSTWTSATEAAVLWREERRIYEKEHAARHRR